MTLPFAALLAVVALAPLFFSDWWGKHYAKVALGLAVIPVIYYLAVLDAPARVLQLAAEYLSFITLIGSLFVVSGGIHINVRGEARPFRNTVFLLIGAVLANLLGTTGASMLLIRPWIRMNKYRVTGHHIAFFILIVSNVGGCLTPIGDPPLFLGYLYGVPFLWVLQKCWPVWSTGLIVLLAMFYFVDRRNFQRAPRQVRELETAHETWRFDGLPNLFFLAVIIGSVFVGRPGFLREALMIAAAIGSYYTTRKSVHESNHFSFTPVKEVAILFIGIFATMMPALDWLAGNASTLLGSAPNPGLFYWGSGALSSVLDNAPTYLAFLSASFGSLLNHDVVAQVHQLVLAKGAGLDALAGPHADDVRMAFAAIRKIHPDFIAVGNATLEQIQTSCLLANSKYQIYIAAVSVGSVFFGANTYIGNGPNFMVKAIADQHKVHTPNFVAYIWKFTLPFMLPMLLIVWIIFFRNSL